MQLLAQLHYQYHICNGFRIELLVLCLLFTPATTNLWAELQRNNNVNLKEVRRKRKVLEILDALFSSCAFVDSTPSAERI